MRFEDGIVDGVLPRDPEPEPRLLRKYVPPLRQDKRSGHWMLYPRLYGRHNLCRSDRERSHSHVRLDALKAGAYVPDGEVDACLWATGDLAPIRDRRR